MKRAHSSNTRFFKAKGRELWDVLMERDYEKGALSILVLGPKGSGKSTLLAHIAGQNLELGDIVLWRGRSRDFWPRFPPELTKVFYYEKDELKVVRTPPGTDIEEDVTDRYRLEKYSSMKELYKKLDTGVINVIYEPSYFKPSTELREIAKIDDELVDGRLWWFDFFIMLSKRTDARFMTLCVDEIDDIFPAGASGALWRALESLQHSLSELREKLVWVFGTTHDHGHIDPRILKKLDGFIYLRGAIAPRISVMRDKRIAMKIKNLGVGIIEIRGRGYGGFEFERIPKDKYLYTVKKEWKGEEPNERQGVKELIIDIAAEKGVEEALLKLRELFSKREIGRSYYYRLRREILEKGGLSL